MEKAIYVHRVNVEFVESTPPLLVITAIGAVPTNGWADAQLVPYIYIDSPMDGYWDFDFIAKRPGRANDVITPIGAVYTWVDFPETVKGVRIHASTNSKEKSISFILPGGDDPWPFGGGDIDPFPKVV